MTVAELISKLQEMPATAVVWLEGECGDAIVIDAIIVTHGTTSDNSDKLTVLITRTE